MSNLVILFIHFIATLARLLGPGGVRSLVAESLLLKHQLLILNRSRQRSPNLSAWDRILAGWMALLVRPTRLLRSAIVLKPSTLLAFHKAMSKRKYRMLFSPNRRRKPGPKGPSAELIHAVVEMKQRNPNWGCPRIAQQIALAFHIQIDKDVVRRILAHHRWPGQDSDGPSWLTFLGHMKDSLWSMDLFRCEAATLRTRTNPAVFIPDAMSCPRVTTRFRPYVYSEQEIRELVKAAAELSGRLRPHTYVTLLLLLYSTGLRIGEAVRLQLGDIDHDGGVLRIQAEKFRKARLVPIRASLLARLDEYVEHRQRTGAPTDSDAPLFWNPRGRPYS